MIEKGWINMKKMTMALVLSFAFFPNVWAQTGFGGSDCGEWIRTPSEGKRQWLIGYMSGLSMMHYLNRKDDDPLNKINSANQIFLWMDNFCKTHPLKNVRTGGQELFIELIQR